MQGLRGRLVSDYFATHVMPVSFAAYLDAEGAHRAHTAFVRLHRAWSAELGPASGVRALFDRAAGPLLHLLQFTAVEPTVRSGDLLTATLRSEGSCAAALIVTTWDADLERRWRDAVGAAHVRATRWCLCFNGRALRLADVTRGHARSHVEFDLDDLVDHQDTFSVLWTVLRGSAFIGGGDRPLIENLLDASAAAGEAICSSLRHGVLDSVGLLLTGLTRGRGGPRRVPDRRVVASAFEQALTIAYRILFLLFAEAHQLVPDWHPVYRDRYTIDVLKRAAMENVRPRGLWEALQAISRLAHAGCEAGDLRVTPFNGRLFSPSAAPLAEHVHVDDGLAREALMALATTRPRPGGREQIAYRDLGVEELGAVYETILDYTPTVHAEAGGSPRWRIALERAGHARKDSSTFYTPRPLTEALVRRTLEPLVRGRTADDVLSLRIVDPAMGSGAFLVSACRFLARAYEDALVEEGRCLPGDLDEHDRARLRRVVAQRCLFGVDLNARAVQLARLSLWLATLAADCPLTFLDHHLRSGDSLVGASPIDVARQPPGPVGRRSAPLPLVDLDRFHAFLSELVPERERVATEPGDTITAIREKERALAALSAPTHDRSRWAAVCDLWCACWFWTDGSIDPRTFADLAERLHGRPSVLRPGVAQAYLDRARTIAEELRCFHWALEFPEVFFDTRGAPLGDAAGFDAVLGNPPWDMVRADRRDGAEDRTRVRHLTRFLRQSGVFQASTVGHANLYQLFVERALQLARRGGRIGLVVPSGLASDHGSTQLRRRLFTQCDTDAIVGFDNRDGVFPIHRSTRFLMFTATKGGPTRAVRCRFGMRSLDAVDGPITPDAGVVLSMEVLGRISRDDLAIPALHSTRDLHIVEKIAARFPAAGDRAGWCVHFGRELNASDDKPRFCHDPDALPVIEGKDITPFAVRIRPESARIAAPDVRRLLGTIPPRRLAYRDVASATNRLTLIAALLPEATASVHTVFCLKTRVPLIEQRILCGVLNSFVANYLVRLRVTTHVGVGAVERLPMPVIRGGTRSTAIAIVKLVERLERSAGADRDAYADLQAHVAVLYELDDDEWRHIVSTFPLVEEPLRRASIARYEALRS